MSRSTMTMPKESFPEPEEGSISPFSELRYSLPALLRDVKRDRASSAFAMEKLDQAAINSLFDHQRSHRASESRKK